MLNALPILPAIPRNPYQSHQLRPRRPPLPGMPENIRCRRAEPHAPLHAAHSRQQRVCPPNLVRIAAHPYHQRENYLAHGRACPQHTIIAHEHVSPDCPRGFDIAMMGGEWGAMARKAIKTEVLGTKEQQGGSLLGLIDEMEQR